MMFATGNHCFSPSADGATVVNVSRVSNFTMKGLGNISYNPSEEGAIQPSSVITCSCSKNKSGILFYKSNTIHIENLTLEDCGTKLVFLKPPKMSFITMSALMFYDSSDIKLIGMRMNRNVAYAMLAEQVFGNFTITNSAFLSCVVFPLSKRTNIGTNARFLYKNCDSHPMDRKTNLLIENSWFLYGGKKSDRTGGLSIFTYCPNVHVLINHITTMYNAGGNLAIHIDDHHENTSSVTINNSFVAYGSAEQGGGLYILIEANQLWKNGTIMFADTSISVVRVLKTSFFKNSAKYSGGGIFINYYEKGITDNIQRHFSFVECQFISNSITHRRVGNGAALHVVRHGIGDTIPHVVPLFSFCFMNCSFEYNELKQKTKEGGIVNFVLTTSIVIEDSNFTFNKGTAIFLQNSIVKFSGHIIFKNNSAMHGGALKFCQSSKMYLPANNVHIDFINNLATSTGGAIDVREHCAETIPPCFFQPADQNISILDMNATLQFVNNVATLAGDAIYGGQVDRCNIINYNKTLLRNVFNWSKTVFAKIFDLKKQNNVTQSTISSSPFGACFCNTSGSDTIDTFNCSNVIYPRPVIPGQTISIGVAAVGQRNGTVPITSVYFEFSNTLQLGSNRNTQLIINNTFQVDRPRTRCNILKCILYSNETRAVFKLTIQQVSPIEMNFIDYKPPNVTLFIEECPWGLVLRNSPPYKCVCNGLLTNYDISCTIDTQVVSIPGKHYYWLGCSTSNGNSCTGLSLAVRCLLGYCKTETISISPETLDHQCSNGREGVLCGRCKQDHSLALGTSRCLPNCPKYLFYIILLVCAASGILLILFLIACNFTVSEGTINGLFFYAHVVHRNSDSFFPADSVGNNIFRLFIAWLNLDFGFEVCFL